MFELNEKSIEQVDTGWLNPNIKLNNLLGSGLMDKLSEKVYLRRFRLGSGNSGYRYYFDQNQYYVSVTTFTSRNNRRENAISDEYDFIQEWRRKLDAENWRYGLGVSANNVLNTSKIYGTFFHKFVSDYIQGNIAKYSASGADSIFWKDRLEADFFAGGYSKADYSVYRTQIEGDFQNDMYAFLQWIETYNVQFLATDLPVKSEKYGIASVVDVICIMDTSPKNKDKKDRKLVVLDFKTSDASAVYADQKKQVCIYLYLLNQMFEGANFEAAYIWKPQSRPSGKFSCTDQADFYPTDQIEADLSLIKAYKWNDPAEKGKTFVQYIGAERVEKTFEQWRKDQFDQSDISI